MSKESSECAKDKVHTLLKRAIPDRWFENSKKHYFKTPWWKFWGKKKVQYETSRDGITREFDQQGRIIDIRTRGKMPKFEYEEKRSYGGKNMVTSEFDQSGKLKRLFITLDGKRDGYDSNIITLDMKTRIITRKTKRRGGDEEQRIFPSGKFEILNVSDDRKNVQMGYLTSESDDYNYSVGSYTLYEAAFDSSGKEIFSRWANRFGREYKYDYERKRVLKDNPYSMDEKVKILSDTSKEFLDGKEMPKTEEEIRTMKDLMEKGRAAAHKKFRSEALADLYDLDHKKTWYGDRFYNPDTDNKYRKGPKKRNICNTCNSISMIHDRRTGRK